MQRDRQTGRQADRRVDGDNRGWEVKKPKHVDTRNRGTEVVFTNLKMKRSKKEDLPTITARKRDTAPNGGGEEGRDGIEPWSQFWSVTLLVAALDVKTPTSNR